METRWKSRLFLYDDNYLNFYAIISLCLSLPVSIWLYFIIIPSKEQNKSRRGLCFFIAGIGNCSNPLFTFLQKHNHLSLSLYSRCVTGRGLVYCRGMGRLSSSLLQQKGSIFKSYSGENPFQCLCITLLKFYLFFLYL